MVPSECYEVFGLASRSVCGRQTCVASDIGGLPSSLETERAALFRPGSVADLTEKVRYLIERPAEMRLWGSTEGSWWRRSMGPKEPM